MQPPRKLGQHGTALWTRVQSEYAITDIGGVEMLCQAAAAVDRLEAIAARISEDGELISTRASVRAHPLIKEETALRAFVVRTLEKLGITRQEIKAPGRPGSFASWSPGE
jgi:hypothetical protein